MIVWASDDTLPSLPAAGDESKDGRHSVRRSVSRRMASFSVYVFVSFFKFFE